MLQSVHVEQRMAAFPLNKINFCLLHRALPDVQLETWRMLWAANRRGISRADLTNLTLIFFPCPPSLPPLPPGPRAFRGKPIILSELVIPAG